MNFAIKRKCKTLADTSLDICSLYFKAYIVEKYIKKIDFSHKLFSDTNMCVSGTSGHLIGDLGR